MNTKEFISELKELIDKFNDKQGVVLTDIKLTTSVIHSCDGSKSGFVDNIILVVE